MKQRLRRMALGVVCVLAGSACAARAGVSPESFGVAAPSPASTFAAAPVFEPPREPEAEPVEPEAPPPVLFAGRETVSYAELVNEIRRVADELATAPEVKASYGALLAENDLTPDDVSIQSYSRVRLVFEATRDGGLWGLKWAITDRMPWSDAIWAQWRALDFAGPEPDVTAVAECDELSAVFALLARDVGIRGFVGLHWPTWNHTVAVWELRRGARDGDPGERVRLMVPTSQVWLSRDATIGSREFPTNRVVFPYARNDVKPETEMPAALARFLIERLTRFGAWSNRELLERRARFGGS